ncbi:MAG: hypothetical protein AAGD25_10210 [Cyanobacteria bacterium P01_F01_bin.150]
METNTAPELSQSTEYQTALACFYAAATLQSENQVINGPRIKAVVGRGSHTTMKKYADLWKALEAGEELELSEDVRAAYDVVKAGSEDGGEILPPPPGELTDLLHQLWEMSQKWISTECRDTWEAAAAQLEVAEMRVVAAEKQRDEAIAHLQQHETERKTLKAQNEELQQQVSTLNGRLEELKLRYEELSGKASGLVQDNHEKAIQVIQLTEQKAGIEGQMADVLEQLKTSASKEDTLQETVEQLKKQVFSVEKSEALANAQVESMGQTLIESQQKQDDLEAYVREQSTTIAQLTGDARAAEAETKQLREQAATLQSQLAADQEWIRLTIESKGEKTGNSVE